MSNKDRNRRKGTDSGYLLPIICIVALTLLSAILITLCFTVILSVEEEPPMTSTPTDRTQLTTSAPTSDQPSSTTTTQGSVTIDPSAGTTPTPSTSTVAPQTTPAPTTPPTPTTTKPIITDPPVTEPPSPSELGFKADLSAYEQYMDPTGDRWDDAYLMLVNVDHRLEPNQEKSYPTLGGLTAFSSIDDYNYRHNPDLTMNENAVMALTAMFIEAKANGIKDLDITSAYRSYSYQGTLFNNNCNKTYHWLCEEEGCTADWIGKSSTCPVCGKKTSNNTLPITQEEKEANVATYSCAPGTSDHQTGLAIDIVDLSLPYRYWTLIQEYGDTESGKWLAENSWKFGFVLRFPEGKEAETGIIYEPWHFRFVGRTHAAQMWEMDMCLEEYSEYLESIGYFD